MALCTACLYIHVMLTSIPHCHCELLNLLSVMIYSCKWDMMSHPKFGYSNAPKRHWFFKVVFKHNYGTATLHNDFFDLYVWSIKKQHSLHSCHTQKGQGQPAYTLLGGSILKMEFWATVMVVAYHSQRYGRCGQPHKISQSSFQGCLSGKPVKAFPRHNIGMM